MVNSAREHTEDAEPVKEEVVNASVVDAIAVVRIAIVWIVFMISVLFIGFSIGGLAFSGCYFGNLTSRAEDNNILCSTSLVFFRRDSVLFFFSTKK